MVVAEHPDDKDDRFNGAFVSGMLKMTKLFLEEQGIDAYYTYAVKCRKPGPKSKAKTATHVKPCATEYLKREMEIVRPKHIIVLGNGSLYGVTKASGITKKQGQRFWSKNANAYVYATYHHNTVRYDQDKRKAFWDEMKLYARLIKEGADAVAFDPPVIICDTIKGLRILQKKIRAAGGRAAVDCETDGLNPYLPGMHVRSIQFCFDKEYGGVFVPLGLAYEDDLYDGTVEKPRISAKTGKVLQGVEIEKLPAAPYWRDESLAEAVQILREILAETKCAWHNGKFDRLWLHNWGEREFGSPIEAPHIWMDTQIVAFMLDENRANFRLKRLIVEEFGFPSYDIPDKMTKDLSLLIPYSTNDTVATLMLAEKYETALLKPDNAKLRRLYTKVVRPMDKIYTEMELEGWPVDVRRAKRYERLLEARLAEVTEEMDTWLENEGILVDRENRKRYTSSDHLAEIIFDEIGLPLSSDAHAAYTKDEPPKRSTETVAFLHIRKHPWMQLLAERKKLEKALTTYVRPMIRQGEARGKLTTSYKMARAKTGRSASSKEDEKAKVGGNLQNISNWLTVNIKEPPAWLGDKKGVSLKNLIKFPKDDVNPITGKKRVLWDADLSQIEMRVAAELSKDPLMVWAYQNGVDLHTYRAIRNFGIDKEYLEGGLDIESWRKVLTEGAWSRLDEKTQKTGRKRAKPVNFGFLFSMWWRKFGQYAALAYDIDYTEAESRAAYELFHSDHAGLQPWYKAIEREANTYGYVESLSGRRRRLPMLKGGFNQDWTDDQKRTYKDAVRQAINAPIQGFGSGDLKLMAIIGIRAELREKQFYRTRAMLLGEVHDSVVGWADEDVVEEVVTGAVKIMRHPPLLDVLGIKLTVPIESEAAIGRSLGELKEFKVA